MISFSLLVFRRPKPVSRKFQSKRSRSPQSTKGGGVIYYVKSEVLDLESNLLFGGGEIIYYRKSEVLDLESNLLFLGEGGNLLHAIGR